MQEQTLLTFQQLSKTLGYNVIYRLKKAGLIKPVVYQRTTGRLLPRVAGFYDLEQVREVVTAYVAEQKMKKAAKKMPPSRCREYFEDFYGLRRSASEQA